MVADTLPSSHGSPKMRSSYQCPVLVQEKFLPTSKSYAVLFGLSNGLPTNLFCSCIVEITSHVHMVLLQLRDGLLISFLRSRSLQYRDVHCFKFEKTLILREGRDHKCCFCRLKLWSGLSVEEVQRTCACLGSEGPCKVR